MVWRCCCVMKTRVSTSTLMGGSSRMWCCSGERCPPLWVSEEPPPASCSEVTSTETSLQPFHHLLSSAYICSNQIMGWGEKAIEIRSVETGHLDGVFMHKRAQRLKFLCERNDKVRQCISERSPAQVMGCLSRPCSGQGSGGVECFCCSELSEPHTPSPWALLPLPQGLGNTFLPFLGDREKQMSFTSSLSPSVNLFSLPGIHLPHRPHTHLALGDVFSTLSRCFLPLSALEEAAKFTL